MIQDWKAEHFFISDEEYPEKIDGDIKNWREECLKDGYFAGYDGTKIHYVYAINEDEKATIVVSHGFCEFAGKYYELLYYFYQAGYSVFFVEHRGHGFSGRKVKEIDKVYVKSYDEYVEDFKVLMDQVVTKYSKTHQYLLYAHSMGGAIGSLFLEEYPKYFKAAVLSSPMQEMDFRGVPNWEVKLLMLVSRFLPWEEKYVPGQHGYVTTYTYETSSCMSQPRYDYMYRLRDEVPEFRTFGGTYAWTRASIKGVKKLIKNAQKVQIPVLLCQAGMDTMVKPGGQDYFAEHSGNTRLVRYPGSKHELFNATDEIRKEYFPEVFGFLEEHAAQ